MAVAVVVDDNEDELQQAVLSLKSTRQFEAVYGFTCPEVAYCLMKERGIDVLFMEVEMKGLNCFVLMDRLRKIGRDILYVIMTSNDGYACEAFQKGIADYVLKPLTAEGAAKTLEKLRKYHKREKNTYCNDTG